MGRGLGQLHRDIHRFRTLSFDTSACIYYLGPSTIRKQAVEDMILRAESGRLGVVLSDIVRLELMVKPFRENNAWELARVELLVNRTRGVTLSAVSPRVVTSAAGIRAATRLSAPDAIVVATALGARVGAIVGNDEHFKRIHSASRVLAMSGPGAVPMPAYIHLDDYV